MKSIMIWKRVRSLAVLAAIAATSVATRPARAQVGIGEANGLIGSWRMTVNVTEPSGFPSFPVLITFHADGTLLQLRAQLYTGIWSARDYTPWRVEAD